MFRIPVESSRRLQAVVLGIAQANREVRKLIRQESQRVIRPVFQEVINSNVSNRAEAVALGATTRVTVSDRNVNLAVGAKKAKMSGGFDTRDAQAFEFGANPEKTKRYKGRRGAKRFDVNRRTQVQFKPNRRKGYVFYPSIAEVAPRALALWTQTVKRAFYEAFEGKNV